MDNIEIARIIIKYWTIFIISISWKCLLNLIVNNTNISELVEKKSYKRIPKNISFSKREDDLKIYWESSHDGYKDNFKKELKYSNHFSFVGLSYLRKDICIQTPKLYCQFGINDKYSRGGSYSYLKKNFGIDVDTVTKKIISHLNYGRI